MDNVVHDFWHLNGYRMHGDYALSARKRLMFAYDKQLYGSGYVY